MSQGPKQQQQDKSDNLRTFMLGDKELDDKTAQFLYDRGWYSIVDVMGEEKHEVYKSRNAQEAYTKWNVYIGRKKERPQRGGSDGEETHSQQSRGQQSRQQPKSNREVLAAEMREQSGDGQAPAKKRRRRNRNRNRQGSNGANGGNES